MVDSNRIVSFDILKGGGILLVILGHIQIPYMLKTVIYSFHMPLFFFVSGCFFRPISLREFFANKGFVCRNRILVLFLYRHKGKFPWREKQVLVGRIFIFIRKCLY